MVAEPSVFHRAKSSSLLSEIHAEVRGVDTCSEIYRVFQFDALGLCAKVLERQELAFGSPPSPDLTSGEKCQEIWRGLPPHRQILRWIWSP